MERIKVCRECRHIFTTSVNSQMFCSAECRQKAYRKKKAMPRARCPVCGRIFSITDSRKKYCSAACRLGLDDNKPRSGKCGIQEKALVNTCLSLDEIAKLAREAGMTYGEYVAKNGLR